VPDPKAALARLRQSALAKNTGWMLVGQGTGILLQAFNFVLLGRLLGTTQYGIYAGAFALVAIVASYSTLGSGTLFLRYVSADHSRFSVYWGNILLVTMTVSGVLVAGLYLLAPHLIDPSSAGLVLILALANCFCSQLTTCAGQVFQTYEKLRFTAGLNLITNLLRCLAAGAMLLFLHRSTAWQWGLASLAVSSVAVLVAVGMVTIKFGWPRLHPGLFFRGATEGFGYSFATSTASAYNDIDKAMLSHYRMNAADGIYTIAYRIVDIATIPVLALRDAAMPRFFRAGANSVEEAGRLSLQLLRTALPVACLASAAMWLAAPLIPHLVGNGFKESVSALRWLCLIPIFRSVHQLTGSALTGSGLQRYRTGSQLSAAGVNFLLNLWLIPTHGWLGAAWASLVTDAGLGVVNWFLLSILRKRLPTTLLIDPSMPGRQS
jgi:O-antigen/teichoic acid export membrane protein